MVWLEEADSGVALRTHEWGAGVERTFGSDTVETSVAIGAPALFTLACALVMDDLELDPTAPALDVLAAAYSGNAAASAEVRRRLEALGLAYEFTMR